MQTNYTIHGGYDPLTAIGDLFHMGLSREEILDMGFSEKSICIAEEVFRGATSPVPAPYGTTLDIWELLPGSPEEGGTER